MGWNHQLLVEYTIQLCGDSVINDYKDPYETTSTMESERLLVFCGSIKGQAGGDRKNNTHDGSMHGIFT